jgi:hypothetical protein
MERKLMDRIQPFLTLQPYYHVADGQKEAARIANRHYSRNTNKARFMPPGERLILLGANLDWLFCWTFKRFRQDDQAGVECNLFRNESTIKSSEIILIAEQECFNKWGSTRLFTFVNSTKIQSTNPGFCFLKAGWKRLNKRSKVNNLIILEKEI